MGMSKSFDKTSQLLLLALMGLCFDFVEAGAD
jgi:hypothetical protein